MKKFAALIVVFLFLFSLAACAADAPALDNVAGVDAVVADDVLEALGMSAEEFAALDPELQQALRDELAAVAEHQAAKETHAPQKQAKYTPDDVMAGGDYVVVLGDYMNSITLYYKNGVLVKIVEEFQKNSTEEAECYTYEGEDLADDQFNFIDWDGVPLQDILNGMKDYGGFGQYQIRPAE